MILLAATSAFIVSAAAVGWLASRGPRTWLVDHPNQRSLHVRPVSRAGGIGILAGLAAGLVLAALSETFVRGHGWVLAGAVLIACISFADDIRSVSAAIRLVFHLAAAGCVVLAGLSVERLTFPGGALALGPVVGSVFTVLFVAWLVNLYNFMDGLDGLAGGMATIGFGTLALLCAHRGPATLVAVGSVTAAASLGFLLFNFPPAKIFMGDLGSSLLGFLAAVLMLWGEQSASVPLWISALVFSPFIVDATVTLVRRVLAGERPWQAHRGHFYQRLARLGWGHREIVVREYGLMLACASSAVAALWAPAAVQVGLLGGWAVVYLCFMITVIRLERRGRA